MIKWHNEAIVLISRAHSPGESAAVNKGRAAIAITKTGVPQLLKRSAKLFHDPNPALDMIRRQINILVPILHFTLPQRPGITQT